MAAELVAVQRVDVVLASDMAVFQRGACLVKLVYGVSYLVKVAVAVIVGFAQIYQILDRIGVEAVGVVQQLLGVLIDFPGADVG